MVKVYILHVVLCSLGDCGYVLNGAWENLYVTADIPFLLLCFMV